MNEPIIGRDISKQTKKGRSTYGAPQAVATLVVLAIIVGGSAFALLKAVEWGNKNRVIGQSIVAQALKFQLPVRVEKVQPEILVSVMTQKVADQKVTPIEKKIMDKWGYKDGVVALAIFDCGESGLDQYAVSHTGDLGIAQINWATWKTVVKERFNYNASDMFDVDKNLDVAYLVWDRGNGKEGDGEGSWTGWSGFNNGRYTVCFK